MSNLQLALLSIALLTAAFGFSKLSRFVADKWTDDGIDEIDELPTKKGLGFSGGSNYPETLQPARRWYVLGKHVFGPFAKIQFSRSGFRLSLPDHRITRSYKRVKNISATWSGYLEINFYEGEPLKIRSSESTKIYRAFKRYGVDVSPISICKIYVCVLLGASPFLLPFFAVIVYFFVTEPDDRMRNGFWLLYPFVLTAMRLIDERRR